MKLLLVIKNLARYEEIFQKSFASGIFFFRSKVQILNLCYLPLLNSSFNSSMDINSNYHPDQEILPPTPTPPPPPSLPT